MSGTPHNVPLASQFMARFGDAYKIIGYSQFGFIFAAYIYTLPYEWSIYRRQRPFRWEMTPFFICRYSVLIAIVPELIAVGSSARLNCLTAYRFIIGTASLEVLAAQFIFSLRAFALFEYRKTIIATLVVCWLLVTGSMVLLFKTDALTILWVDNPLLGGGNCVVTGYLGWRFLLTFGLILAIDVLLIALISGKLFTLRKHLRSSFTDSLARDGLVYLSLVAVPTITAIVLFADGADRFPRMAVLGVTCCIHALVATQAFMNLAHLSDRLPLSLRTHISGGSLLDEDTLSRIAWIQNGVTSSPTFSQMPVRLDALGDGKSDVIPDTLRGILAQSPTPAISREGSVQSFKSRLPHRFSRTPSVRSGTPGPSRRGSWSSQDVGSKVLPPLPFPRLAPSMADGASPRNSRGPSRHGSMSSTMSHGGSLTPKEAKVSRMRITGLGRHGHDGPSDEPNDVRASPSSSCATLPIRVTTSVTYVEEDVDSAVLFAVGSDAPLASYHVVEEMDEDRVENVAIHGTLLAGTDNVSARWATPRSR